MRCRVVLGVVLLASCILEIATAQEVPPQPSVGAADATTAVPDDARLKARVVEFYAAAGSRNARVIYGMQTPYLRSETSFDDFRRETGMDEAWSRQPATKLTVDLDQACYCRDWEYPDGSKAQRCVLVLHGVEEGPGGRPVQDKRILAMWDYANGEWYYGSPGEGDRCPSPDDGRREVRPQPSGEAAGPGGAPNEARLNARIREFSEAVDSRNARAMYAMQTPYIRSHMSFEDYRRDWKLDEEWSKQPATEQASELDRVCSCDDWMYPDGSETVRCVLLRKVRQEKAGGRQEPIKWLEMWEYANGEWYFGMPGEGDRCPSEMQPPRMESVKVGLPDEDRLKVRLREFYGAIVAADARALYALENPRTRSKVPFDKYEQYGAPRLRDLLLGTAASLTIELVQPCSCQRIEYPPGAEKILGDVICRLLVQEARDEAGGEKRVGHHVDNWEYTDGEWYYRYSDMRDQCPPDEGG